LYLDLIIRNLFKSFLKVMR